MKIQHLFLLLFTALLITGCAGRQLMQTPNLYHAEDVGPFGRLPPELETNTVDLLYVTDRLPETDEQGRFLYGSGRSLSMAFGSAIVRIGDDISWEELRAESSRAERRKALNLTLDTPTELGRFPATPYRITLVSGEPKKDAAALRDLAATTRAFRQELNRRLALTPRNEVFIYIHGYNNTFADAAFTQAELWHFFGRKSVPLLYTWPAGHGNLLQGYGYDRESGQFTLYHLKELLRVLGSFSEVEKIHILAHSRGTDVAVSALRELFIETWAAGGDPRARFRIANLVLAAPDLDAEVLSQRVIAERLGLGIGQVTVYTSKKDQAIGAADFLFASRVRLGRATADVVPQEVLELVPDEVNVYFVENRLKAGGAFGHGYFHTNPASVSDIILVIRDERRPGEEHGRPLEPSGVSHGWILTDDYMKAP